MEPDEEQTTKMHDGERADRQCHKRATWVSYESQRYAELGMPSGPDAKEAAVGRFCSHHAAMYDVFCVRFPLNPGSGFRCEEQDVPPITYGPLCAYWDGSMLGQEAPMCRHASCYAIVTA